MIYYNRFYGIVVFDICDYFIISAMAGASLAPYLKEYLSEKAATERLKKSIISKSRLLPPSKKQLQKENALKIYRFAISTRGGQLDKYHALFKQPDPAFKLAQQIQKFVRHLAAYLKRKEMRGILKIFFKQGRLVLQLILSQYNINLSYLSLGEGLNTQVIVITSLVGGTAGFTVAWLSVGATLVSVPFLATLLLAKSFKQQWLNNKDYKEFKETMKIFFDSPEIKGNLFGYFDPDLNPPMTSGKLEWGAFENYKNNIKHNFPNSSEELEAFIKKQMEEQFGLIENPTDEQLHNFIEQASRRNRPKTIGLQDLLNNKTSADLLDDVKSTADLVESQRDSAAFGLESFIDNHINNRTSPDLLDGPDFKFIDIEFDFFEEPDDL